jgi:hypothetical protein
MQQTIIARNFFEPWFIKFNASDYSKDIPLSNKEIRNHSFVYFILRRKIINDWPIASEEEFEGLRAYLFGCVNFYHVDVPAIEPDQPEKLS